MTGEVLLPNGLALGIIAFLLSLLPAGFFIYLWYLRNRDRTIPAWSIALAFVTGMFLVIPAFQIEDIAERLWQIISPSTAHFFAGPVLPLQGWVDVLLPAIGTFVVVATVEEGLRYIVMRVWLKYSALVDQVFDGLLLGLAVGLGFATLENTLYFLGLFREGSYDTLVFVFFLRFLISTLAHVSFAGLMGTLVTQGYFDFFRSRQYYVLAFFIPWFLHGLYDLLLGINFGLYAVILLIAPLAVFIYWTQRRDFSIIHRKDGKMLAVAEVPQTKEARAIEKVLKTFESPWNKQAPWLKQSRAYRKILEGITRDES